MSGILGVLVALFADCVVWSGGEASKARLLPSATQRSAYA